MTKKQVEVDSFNYKKLKHYFPHLTEFYYWYESGDYYNTAKTHFYDKDGNELDVVNHGYYG